MNLDRFRRNALPRPLRPHTTSSGGGNFWRTVVGVLTVAGLSMFLASVVWEPSKRNIQALAGLIFLGIVLVAEPFKALLFVMVVIPYPAHTSVGTTSILLIFAVAGLTMVKARQLNLNSPFIRKDLDMAIMGFFLTVFLSFYAQQASAMLTARYIFLGLISAGVLYYVLIYLITDERRLMHTIYATQFVLLTLTILGLFQWLFPDKQLLPAFFSFSRKVATMEEVRRGEVRVTATFNGQELFAEYLALSTLLQYVLFRRARTMLSKAFWIGSITLLILCLFATATRGAFLSLVGGFFYLVIVGGKVIPRSQSLKVVFVAIAVFYLSLSFIEPLVAHLMDRMLTIGSQDSSLQSRAGVLEQAFQAVGDSPFLGHGLATPPGTFRGPVTANIHNLYVTLAYTIGLPGLIAFAWMMTILFRLSWQTFSNPLVPRPLRELALGLNVMLVMFLVDEIKIEFTRQALYMHMVWTMFAWIVCVWKIGLRYSQPGER